MDEELKYSKRIEEVERGNNEYRDVRNRTAGIDEIDGLDKKQGGFLVQICQRSRQEHL